ncbi:hypothetical protein ACHAXN_006252 [Cyclotella atomus]
MNSLLRPSFLLRSSPRLLSSAASQQQPAWVESLGRISESAPFPNEYPGQNYMFNWCLNADGVTPLNKSAFRITKPLDLKVAGLDLPKTSPLKVDSKSERSKMPEAGSDTLNFETFDEILQRTKDTLSTSSSLYCPEGHVPGKRVGVRIITNNKALAPELLAYLERMPKRDPKPQSITCYVLESDGTEEFSGYAIEEIEENVEGSEGKVAVSVASVVVCGKKPSLKRVVAGIELSVEGLEADAREREEKKAAAASDAEKSA